MRLRARPAPVEGPLAAIRSVFPIPARLVYQVEYPDGETLLLETRLVLPGRLLPPGQSLRVGPITLTIDGERAMLPSFLLDSATLAAIAGSPHETELVFSDPLEMLYNRPLEIEPAGEELEPGEPEPA